MFQNDHAALPLFSALYQALKAKGVAFPEIQIRHESGIGGEYLIASSHQAPIIMQSERIVNQANPLMTSATSQINRQNLQAREYVVNLSGSQIQMP